MYLHSFFSFIVSIVFIASLSLVANAQIPAFPNAEGYGSTTIGGRQGVLIKVTNLNDSGPGSLREAISYEGARIIIFEVGGIINLENKLTITEPFVTIAGQTAPGNGICIRGEGLRIATHDVIMRYVRVRPGEIDYGPPNNWGSLDAVTIGGNSGKVYNIILDHCSFSWAVDENMGIWNDSYNITIQNCIIGEALHRSKHPKGPHGMGILIGNRATNISIHHNLIIHNNDRNPHINGENKVDFRNNVIYNPGGVAIDLVGKSGQAVNLVNNMIIKGPSTRIKSEILLRNSSSQYKLYLNGNVGINQDEPPEDNWLLIRDMANRVPDRSMRALQAFPHPEVTTLTAKEAYTHVLQNAGAVLPLRDAVDRALIHDVKNRKGGLIDSKDHPIEWPMYDKGIPLLDTDEDGMPDHWENNFGLNLTMDDSQEDSDNDGYTNLEEYLNKTDPKIAGVQIASSISPLVNGEIDYDAIYSSLTFGIDSIFPNPVTGNISNMKFAINRPSDISIKILDEDGKEVKSLVNAYVYEGQYQIMWDSSRLTPGIYLILLISEDNNASYKVIVSK